MHLIRPWLAISKVRETNERSTMYAYNIGAILQLAYPAQHPGIASLYIPVEDGEPLALEKLRTGITFAHEQKAAGHKLAIGCGAGISRSVTYAMAVLHEEEQISLVEAYDQIAAVHPEALPHFVLLKSLGEYYQDAEMSKNLLQRIWGLDEYPK